MKKKYLSALIILVSSYSQAQSLYDSLSQYYPLQVGNYWQYSTVEAAGASYYSKGQQNVYVEKDTVMNNKHYAKIYDSKRGKIFARYDSITYNFYELSTDYQKEILADSSLLTYGQFTGGRVNKIYTENVLSQSSTSREIYYSMPFYDEYTKVFSSKFGMTYWFWRQSLRITFSSRLTYCKISGKEYGVFTKVNQNIENSIANYSLSQNYPNPFNPTTNIKYQLWKDSEVQLDVYDILGKKLYSFVNQYQTKGEYIQKFDGSNLPSGIYFYRIKIDNFTETKKIVLAK